METQEEFGPKEFNLTEYSLLLLSKITFSKIELTVAIILDQKDFAVTLSSSSSCFQLLVFTGEQLSCPDFLVEALSCLYQSHSQNTEIFNQVLVL